MKKGELSSNPRSFSVQGGLTLDGQKETVATLKGVVDRAIGILCVSVALCARFYRALGGGAWAVMPRFPLDNRRGRRNGTPRRQVRNEILHPKRGCTADWET